MALLKPLGGEVTVHIDAPVAEVWALVSDVTRIGEFSPETFEAKWTSGSTGPEVGATFAGHVKRNGVGPTYWSPCRVTRASRERGLRVLRRHRRGDAQQLGLPAAPRGGGTDVTEYFRLEPALPMRLYWLLLGRLRGRTNQQGHAHDPRAHEGGAGGVRRPMSDNRAAMLDKITALDAEHAKAVAGGGERSVQRHHDRGKLMPRERIELLVDEGSAFLELSPLAGWGSDFKVGASVVTGIGVVEGVECMITANDPSVKGGAQQPLDGQEDLPRRPDRRGERPADDLPGRVRRRRPADAEGDLHPRRQAVPRHHARLGAPRPRPSRWSSATPPPAAPTCPA